MSTSKNAGALSDALLSLASNVAGEIHNQNTKSVASISSDFMVNPLCFVDARLSHLPETFDIVSGALTFFTSCYVASLCLVTNTKITNALSTLDQLNPKRKSGWETYSKIDLKNRSIEVGINRDNSSESNDFSIKLFTDEQLGAILRSSSHESAPMIIGESNNTDKKIEESQPLSLGKRIYIDVSGDGYKVDRSKTTTRTEDQYAWKRSENTTDNSELKVDENNGMEKYTKTAKKSGSDDSDKRKTSNKVEESTSEMVYDTYRLPLTTRFSTSILSGGLMLDFLTLLGADRSFLGRYRAFTTGRISFGELLTMSDIVKSKTKLLLKDTSGRIKEIYNRKFSNAVEGISSGNHSLGTIANTVVISDRTRKEAEAKLGMRFSKFKDRENFMAESSTMILIVVDEDTDMTTMYVHSYESYSEIPISDFKRASKKSDSNITDIIKAFGVGNVPSF